MMNPRKGVIHQLKQTNGTNKQIIRLNCGKYYYEEAYFSVNLLRLA